MIICPYKSNRTLALGDKQQGRFIRIDQLPWTGQQPAQARLKGLDFPVLLSRQAVTDKDRSTGILYLACSDLGCVQAAIGAIYQKRWKVEVFHKTLKSDTALAKSPTRRVRTQGNHAFLSIYAAYRLAFNGLQTLKCVT